jgi:hypothetical protein
MATGDPMGALIPILENVGLTESSPLLLDSSSSALNPLQIYRTHLAAQLAPIVGTDPSVISSAIQRTVTSENGDLVLPIPALRIKEKEPDELAKLIQEKVGTDGSRYFHQNLDTHSLTDFTSLAIIVPRDVSS